MAERTCVICRGTDEKFNLLRFVLEMEGDLDPPSLKLDILQEHPGRGAYCHSSVSCALGKNTGDRLLSSLLNRKQGKRKVGRREKSARAVSSGFEEIKRGILQAVDSLQKEGKGRISKKKELQLERLVQLLSSLEASESLQQSKRGKRSIRL